MRRKAGEAARARDRQAAAASQDEADESDATEEEATGGRTTRVGDDATTARWHEGCSENPDMQRWHKVNDTPSQNERPDESDATEEVAKGGRTTRVGRPRGGMKVAARIGEGRLRREIERGRRPRVS